MSSNIFQRLAARFIISAGAPPERNSAVFDIETDGLDATTVHCFVIAAIAGDRVYEYDYQHIEEGLEHLSQFDYLVGHNIVNFDLPVLRRLYGWVPAPDCVVLDTLVCGRLILPHISDLDDQAAAMGDPPLGKLRGRYSIEAWGTRLGMPKVGADLDFSTYTPEMMARCVADTLICKRTWQFLQPDGYSEFAIELEHRVAPICNEITTAGIYFDRDAAKLREQEWTARRAVLEAQLHKEFPGVNLNSRQQIGKLLLDRGWIPEERTEKTNQPKISDEVLEDIAKLYPEFAGLSEHYVLGRRLAQLAHGDKAWIKHVAADGRIHGGIISIGTPHSRAKHASPNLAQVPNPKRNKPLSVECRSLFKARNGWVLVAADQATLQDRAFAHYLAEHDGGKYAKDFLAGFDTHWHTATALGLVDYKRNKESKLDTVIRESSKGFRYAFLFGAGAPRLGLITANIVRAVHRINPDSDLPRRFFGSEAQPKASAIQRIGKQSLDKFETATPGLRQLRIKLQNCVQRRGWLPGLDGRRVPVSAQYKALNYIITASEAIICKRWLVRTYDELCEKFRYGWDGDVVLVLWIHDEIVAACRPEIAEQVGAIMVANAKEAGEFYHFGVRLDADFKVATNWGGGDEPARPRESGNAETAAAAEIPSIVPEPDVELVEDTAEPEELEEPEPVEEQALAGDELSEPDGQDVEIAEAPAGLAEALADIQAFIAAAAAGSPLEGDEKPRARSGNGHDVGGNGFDRTHGDYRNIGAKTHTADKPYGPIRARLLSQGYHVAKTFSFVVPGEAAPRFYEDRFELNSGLAPTEARPRKTSRFWHQLHGRSLNGTGPRRIIFNWPAIIQAAPDAVIFVTEGANKSAALNQAGLIATAAPYHQWGPDCVAALSGRHLIYHEDHDFPDAHGAVKAQEFSAEARKKLGPVAASFHIVPALHLWKSLEHSGAPPHGWDVKDWLEAWVARGNDPAKLLEICREVVPENNFAAIPLTIEEWLSRDLPPLDPLIGSILSTTTRALLAAPTGIGKTNFGMALWAHAGAGKNFLHWHVSRPCRVLFIDGEMSRRLLRERIEDMARRLGGKPPETALFFNKEDIENFAPLNTREGHDAIWKLVEEVERRLGGPLDAIEFDNIVSLLVGDMKEEDAWRDTMPLVHALTKRRIGQLWLHHTGHDASRGYGTKTREWQLDMVMHLTKVERTDTDLAFTLSFPKARERTPDNRDDFAEVEVTLIADQWMADTVVSRKKEVPPLACKFLEALEAAIRKCSITTIDGFPAAPLESWRTECIGRGLIEGAKADSNRALFSKNKLQLIAANLIGANAELAWVLP